jgi:hypothetical protein
LFAVFGGLATLSAWLAVMALNLETLLVGSGWLLVGVTTYVIYRRRRNLSLTESRKVTLPTPVGAAPVEYASVVLAFEDGTYSEGATATALKLASHKRGDVRVVVTVTVPQHLDLTAPLPEAEATAQAIIEATRQWAGRGQRIKGVVAKVRAAEAGHRIVREAVESKADAIVMALPHHRPPGKVLNKTLETVLGKRPCRVIIDSAAAYPFERIRRAA